MPDHRLLILLLALTLAPPAFAEQPDEASEDENKPLPHEDPALREQAPEILHVDRDPVDDADNAWPLLLDAAAAYQPPEQASLDPQQIEPWVHAARAVPADDASADAARRYLQANAEALQLLDEALQRPTAQSPIQHSMNDLPGSRLNNFRDLAGLQMLRAKLAWRDDDADAAFEHLAGIQRHADHVAHAGRSLITFLIGQGIASTVPTHIHKLLETDTLDQADLRRALALLHDAKPLTEAAVQAVRAEFWGVFAVELDRFTQIEAQAAAPYLSRLSDDQQDIVEDNPVIDADRTRRIAARHYAYFVDMLRAPAFTTDRDIDEEFDARSRDIERREQAVGEILDDLQAEGDDGNPAALNADQQRQFVDAFSNIAGETLLQALLPDLTRTVIVERNLRAHRTAVALVTACLLYEKQHDRLPESLDQLVEADLIPAVPRDPFDDKPFRYAPDRRLIWSVGRDRKNDNATTTADTPQFQNPDLVWEIPE